MKQLILTAIIFVSALQVLDAQVAAQYSKTDKAICTAIARYLKGNSRAVIIAKTAKKDLEESSWPEVQCSVDGTLDLPAAYKNITVRKVAEGKFKYECTCPAHRDKFVDFCTMTAEVKSGKVVITHVTWDKTK